MTIQISDVEGIYTEYAQTITVSTPTPPTFATSSLTTVTIKLNEHG